MAETWQDECPPSWHEHRLRSGGDSPDHPEGPVIRTCGLGHPHGAAGVVKAVHPADAGLRPSLAGYGSTCAEAVTDLLRARRDLSGGVL